MDIFRPQTPKKFEKLPPKPIKPITEEWQGRPVPEVFGTLDEEGEKKAYERKKAASKAVDISQLFSKKYDKELMKMQRELEWSRWEKRWEEADAAERNHLMHLMRKEQALLHHSGVMEQDWEAEYLSQRKLLQKIKKKEKKEALRKRNKLAAKEKSYLNRIGASLEIWGAFREGKRGTTKAQRKAAAIMIQKHVRGWLARRKFQKIKEKSRVHAASYTGFVKYYSRLMNKVARWHGVKTPTIHIDLKQVEEFMDKKRYFENVFARRAFPKRTIEYQELAGFFKECDLYPTQREMYNAVLGVTRKTPDNPQMALNEQQVAEIAFMIYVPDGTGLDKTKTRKSTWLNPLIDGKEANKFIGSKEYHNAKLSASMQLVFAAHKERKDKEETEMRRLKGDGEVDKEEDEESLTEEEKKKKQLEDWIRMEREREKLEEKRSRPTRDEEVVTYYQRGEEGLEEEIQ
ncbi:IQ domain-containing protein M [Holothuria leucospilota]|uniref:IQ domain-containing protein M n=1 Tax=Holothuria leucospilota TaxID=206669 RepID=A0A9Q1BKZ5_HOLLE|nr:IQ domain-containing protein M [Holothuria leucospilota]